MDVVASFNNMQLGQRSGYFTLDLRSGMQFEDVTFGPNVTSNLVACNVARILHGVATIIFQQAIPHYVILHGLQH